MLSCGMRVKRNEGELGWVHEKGRAAGAVPSSNTVAGGERAATCP